MLSNEAIFWGCAFVGVGGSFGTSSFRGTVLNSWITWGPESRVVGGGTLWTVKVLSFLSELLLLG